MEQDKIWDYYQNTATGGFSSNWGRLDYVAKLVRAAQTVLTIGVGDLYLEEELLRKGISLSVLDPSSSSIDKAINQLGLCENSAKVGYSQKIPFDDNSFDTVVMSEVLEHLDSEVLIQTLAEVFRVLKPGGSYIGTVPYRERLENSIVICPSCECVFHKVGHVQSFSEHSLRELLSSRFDSNNVHVWVRFLPSWRILNVRGLIVSGLKKLLEPFGLYSGRSNIIFRAVKA